MSSAYDQQIKKLVDHIQSLNQALHERNMQIVHWQQVARSLQDERTRLARGLLDQVKAALQTFSTRFQGLKSENKKLRTYIDHQKQLHENVARDLQGQLQYALARIEELAGERSEWRHEVNTTRAAAIKYQQQAQELKGVYNSQQNALLELRARLEEAQGFDEVRAQLELQIAHLQGELENTREKLTRQEQAVSAKERQLQEVQQAFDAFKIRANEEVAALEAEVRAAKEAAGSVDDRAEDLTKLLANSEQEVAKLFKELSKERELRKEAEILKEAAQKELSSSKRKITKLEKDKESAQNKDMAKLLKQVEEFKTRHDEIQARYDELQLELTRALKDKTDYMKAVEGQKGKVRPLKDQAEGGS